MQKTFNQQDLTKQVKAKMLPSNIFSALSILCTLVPSIVVVMMVERLLNDTMDSQSFIISAVVIAFSMMLKAIFYGLSMWKAHDAAYGSLAEIRMGMIEHMKKMPLSFFQKRKAGELTNIINHDVEQVEVYLAHGLPEIMSATLIPAIIFLVVVIMDWRLGLSLISTLPIIILMRKGLNKLWGGKMKKFSQSTRKMTEDLMEYIATIPVIKAFSREETKTHNVLAGIQDYLCWVKKVLYSITIPMSFISMLLEGGLVVTIIVGSQLLSSGQIGIEKFILALILGGVFSASFAKLATFQHYSIVFNQAMYNIGSVLGVAPPNRSNRFANTNSGDIVLEDVSFSYNGKEENLSQVSLTFKEGSVNAIVGSSGSGKSTLANLIMGFWEPNSGTISIGGKNIADMTEQALNSLVSIVQQEVFLFNLSIAENIRIGRQDATMEEVIEVAKKAMIHDFITSLPNSYDTMAGEAGVKFSGGEKQRISIARMMLKNAPIIILDEATAAIDPNNEHLIQKAISNLGENKTIITIAHHLNTVVGADQIVVMDTGKIIAAGKHKEILESCPLYAEMVKQQDKVDTWQIKEELA